MYLIKHVYENVHACRHNKSVNFELLNLVSRKISQVWTVNLYKVLFQKGLCQCQCHAVFGRSVAGEFKFLGT